MNPAKPKSHSTENSEEPKNTSSPLKLQSETQPVGRRECLGRAAFGIFSLALAVRLIHLWQIQRAPFFTLLMGDARVYHDWAMTIAGGDWLGKGVFYQAPFYPYFLGLIYTVFKGSLVSVHVVQAVLGAFSCVMLGQAGCRFFSKRTGVVAGVILALYAPAIFFDGLIQKSALDLFFVCLVLWLMGELAVTPRRALWFSLGLAMGCLSLTRENALIFVGVILVWLFLYFRSRGKERLFFAFSFVLGLVLVLLPVALRNQFVGGEFHLTTSQFGPNFYIGNNEHAEGTYRPLRPGRGDAHNERKDATELAQQASGRSLTPGEVSSYWTGQVLHYVASHPWDWLKLMGRKLALACNAIEPADTEDQYTYADWSIVLRVAGYLFHWGVIVPLAVFGLWVTWPRRPNLWVLYLMLAGYLASMVMFYIFARYRHPMAPFLILFAAAGLVEGLRFFKESSLWSKGVCLTLVLGMGIFCNRPIISKDSLRVGMLINMGSASVEKGRFEDAIRYGRQALQISPAAIEAYSTLGAASAKLKKLDEAAAWYRQALQIDPDYADAHASLGSVLLSQGKVDEALEHYNQALRLQPGSSEIHHDTALALEKKGNFDAASVHYAEALRLKPDFADAHYNLGVLDARKGKVDDAMFHYAEALRFKPQFAEAHYNLGLLLAQKGKTDEAISHFAAALKLQPDDADTHSSLGMGLAAKGNFDQAIDHLQQAIRLKPDSNEARLKLAAFLFQRGRVAEAVAHYRELARRQPDRVELLNNLSWILATHRDGKIRNGVEAVQLAERACALSGEKASSFLDTLAAAYAEGGRFDDAVTAIKKAIALAETARQTNSLPKFRQRLELYQSHQPYREPK